MQQQELFQQYELKGWQFSPRLYKIIGASAIINMLAFFLMAQSNFLSGKTCDSPLASGVCSVLDALYVGSEIVDGQYVREDYRKTELEDADITFVEFAEPFKYPEGYFATANPEQLPEIIDPTMIPPTDMNGFPNSANPTIVNPGGTGDIMNTTPITPKPIDKPVVNGLPNSILGGTNPTINRKNNRKNNRNNTVNNVTPNNNTVAENDTDKTDKTEEVKPDETEVVEEVKINKKPFEDLGDTINAKLEKNEVDLNKNFAVVMSGAITADGKLDQKKSKFVSSNGDEEMVNLAKSAIEAVGNSGFLGHLKNQGIENVSITIKQDDSQISILVVSQLKTAETAKSKSSGFNTLLSGLIYADRSNIKKLDDNSRMLVNNSKVTSEDKNFVLTVNIPKNEAQAMINKSLKDRAEKKNKQLSNSGELNTSSNTTDK